MPRPTAVAGLTSRRILVVDDNVDAAEALAMMLRLSGHEVADRVRRRGGAARRAAAFPPDVVLLDLGMPRLNGYDTARPHARADRGAGTSRSSR